MSAIANRSQDKPKHHPLCKLVGARHEAALLLKQAGWSDNRIGKALTVTEKTVRTWRIAQGLAPLPKGTPKIDPIKAREMYEQRDSDGVIAKALGVAPNAILCWRRKHHLAAHYGAPPLSETARRRGMALLRQGYSQLQVSEALGCSSTTVVNLRRRIRGAKGIRKPGRSVRSALQGLLNFSSAQDIRTQILRAIGDSVSKDVAEDAADDHFLALWEDRAKPEDIKKDAHKFVRAVIDKFASRYGPSSLDATTEEGLSLGDLVIDVDAEEEMDRAAERAWDERRTMGEQVG